MTPGHRQWKKSILTGGALCAAWWPFPLFIWNSNTSLGLNLFILIWTTPLGLNVTSAIPPFIYSVGPGNHFMLLDSNVFFALFFVAGDFRSDFSCHPFLFRLICLFFFKMGQRPFCLCLRILLFVLQKHRGQTQYLRGGELQVLFHLNFYPGRGGLI